MKTLSFAAILLAGAAAFSGVARADETTTAANKETARVARDAGDLYTGAPALETRRLSVPHQPAGIGPEIAYGDRAFLGQGNRGIGNN